MITIGKKCFEGCSNLSEVTIPKSVTSIGANAFDRCNSLTDVYYNGTEAEFEAVSGYDEVGEATVHYFNPADYEYSVLADGTIRITKYNGTDSVVEIPSQIDGKVVTSIGNSAFKGCTGLTSIDIPDSVTSVGDTVFEECTGLASITIPESVTSIGSYAFSDTLWFKNKRNENPLVTVNGILIDGRACSGDVEIPDGVIAIGDCAFEGCEDITSVNIPDSVKTIGNSAFSLCENLGDVVIPNGVTTIGDWAFAYCESMNCIDIPVSVTKIGRWAFNGCKNLKHVYYSGTEEQWKAVTIGSENAPLLNATMHYGEVTNHYFEYTLSDDDYDYAIYSNETAEITKYHGNDSIVVIPSHINGIPITVIGNYKIEEEGPIPIGSDLDETIVGAFQECNAETIILPDTVVSIERQAFARCKNLKELQLSENLKSIGYDCIYDCANLTSLDLPEGLETISQSGICYCPLIKSLVVPKSVTTLGREAIGYQGPYWYRDKVKGFVIKCYKNSAAHQYAIDNGFAYELLDESVDELKYQFRENEDGTTDLRFILIADEADVLAADSAQFYATIDGVDTDSVSINRAYRSLIAGTKKITADEGKVFLIGKLLDVPEDMIYSVVAHFTLGEKTFSRVVRHVVTNGEILWQGSADLLKWKTGQNISLENNNNFRYGDTLFIDATPIDESASGSLAVYAVVEEDGEDVAYDLYNLEGEPEIYSVEAKTTVRVPLDEESIQTLNKAKELIVNGSNVNISKVSYIIV